MCTSTRNRLFWLDLGPPNSRTADRVAILKVLSTRLFDVLHNRKPFPLKTDHEDHGTPCLLGVAFKYAHGFSRESIPLGLIVSEKSETSFEHQFVRPPRPALFRHRIQTEAERPQWRYERAVPYFQIPLRKAQRRHSPPNAVRRMWECCSREPSTSRCA